VKSEHIKSKLQYNNMNKVFLTLMLCLFLFSFTSAESETYKVNTETNLQFNCILNGETASAGSTFNITITDREGNYLVNDAQTQAQGDGSFNYTTMFTEIGIYKVIMVCGDGTYSYSEEGEYNITPSGFVGSLGFYFIILILSLGIMILGFALRDAIIVILSSFGLYFVGLYILFFGIDGFRDPVYTWAIAIIILFLAAYISLKSALEMIED